MKSRPHKSAIAALAATALLALPAVAGSATDYSKNAATGDYTAAEPQDEEIYIDPSTGFASGQKDYSKNGATGDYSPAEAPSVEVVTAADDDGFAWGAAAIGAGVTLALVLTALGATVIRRRRIASPAT
jgi:hypothetical protein